MKYEVRVKSVHTLITKVVVEASDEHTASLIGMDMVEMGSPDAEVLREEHIHETFDVEESLG